MLPGRHTGVTQGGGMLRRVLLVLALCAPGSLVAQVRFGYTEVKLGQARADVLTRLLRADFAVDSVARLAGLDTWKITTRRSQRLEGEVTFRGGRLAYLFKDWSPQPGDGNLGPLQAAIDAVHKLLGERDRADCVLGSHTGEISESQESVSGFFLSCGPGHDVSVMISRPRVPTADDVPRVQVIEWVGSLKPRP